MQKQIVNRHRSRSDWLQALHPRRTNLPRRHQAIRRGEPLQSPPAAHQSSPASPSDTTRGAPPIHSDMQRYPDEVTATARAAPLAASRPPSPAHQHRGVPGGSMMGGLHAVVTELLFPSPSRPQLPEAAASHQASARFHDVARTRLDEQASRRSDKQAGVWLRGGAGGGSLPEAT
jgi:hypothetical protein